MTVKKSGTIKSALEKTQVKVPASNKTRVKKKPVTVIPPPETFVSNFKFLIVPNENHPGILSISKCIKDPCTFYSDKVNEGLFFASYQEMERFNGLQKVLSELFIEQNAGQAALDAKNLCLK